MADGSVTLGFRRVAGGPGAVATDDRSLSRIKPGMESVLPRARVRQNCMRNPAIRVLLVVLLAAVLVAGAGVVVSGDASTSSVPDHHVASASPTFEPTHADATDPDRVDAISQDDSPSQVDATFDPDSETRIRVDLRPDRDARWEIAVRYEFDDANQTAPFERVGERFMDGEVGPDPALFERFAADASANVDREMAITNIDREVVVTEDPAEMDLENGTEDTVEEPPAAVGELRLAFVWTEFLAEDGENLELGDALTTPDDGTWLQSLEASQTIVVMTPEGYSVIDTQVPIRDNAVIVEGPRVFEGDDRIAVVYSPTSTQPGPSTPPWLLLAGAIVLGALLIAGGLVGYRRVGPNAGDERSGGPTGEVGAGESNGGPAPGPNGIESDGAGGDAEAEPDLSLLSDEERVERLLERNGGRMRQADIVSETGWSDAKVSQLLSTMSDEGRVEKLRLGRENLISVPDHGASDDEDESSSSD